MTALWLALSALALMLWLAWLWLREARRAGLGRRPPLWGAGALVLVGASVYAWLGYSPDTARWLEDEQRLRPLAEDLLAGRTPQVSEEDTPSAGAMARVLQRRLAVTPTAEGWAALGLIYGDLEAPQLVEQSARRALALEPESASHRLMLAQALMAQDQGRLGDEARALLQAVLARDPLNDAAWMWLGMGASESRDYDLAIQAWRQLLSRHADSPVAEVLQRSLAQAEQQQALSPRFAALQAEVTAAGVAPGGTLFVYLQKAGERGQPLAARRLLVSSFPVQVSLGPEDWLQAYPESGELELGARYAPASGGVEQAELSADRQPWQPGAVPRLTLRSAD